MLLLEKMEYKDTCKIKVCNRLFYVITLDGLSMEESCRLWEDLTDAMSILQGDDESYTIYSDFVHYVWWEKRKVAVLFITGDVIDRSKEIGLNLSNIVIELADFESNILIPFCSMSAINFIAANDSEQNNEVASRVGITTNDKTGEVFVNAPDEIFHGCFRTV